MKKRDALSSGEDESYPHDAEDYKVDNDDNEQLNDAPQEEELTTQGPKESPGEEQVQGSRQRATKGKYRARPLSSAPKKPADPLLASNYNRSSQRQSGWVSSSKHVPKNILHDKEQLYDEIIHLKQTMNDVRQENLKLKTKIQQSDGELSRKDKEIKDLSDRIQNPSVGTFIKEIHGKRAKTGAHLVMALKKRVQDTQKENAALREGLQTLKKNIRLTTTQELDTEVQTYADECVRLRKMLEDMVGEKQYLTAEDVATIEEKIRQQNQVIDGVKRENQSLRQKLQQQEAELSKLKSGSSAKKTASPKEKESLKQQVLAKEQMREIQKLKEEIEGLKKSAKQQQQAEEARKEKAALDKQLSAQDDTIRSLEMKLIDCKRSKDGEIKALRDQLEAGQRSASKQAEEPEETEELAAKTAEKVPILELRDVQEIAAELRLKLMLAKVLFKNCEDDEQVSIHEIARVLGRSPGCLKKEEAVKLARYIVEPRVEQTIEYNELAEEPLASVIEGLSLLVDEYSLVPVTEPEKVQESLVSRLNHKLEPLLAALQEAEVGPGQVGSRALFDVSAKLELQLGKEEIDYMMLTMYRKSKDVARLPYAALIEHLDELGCSMEADDENSHEEKHDEDQQQEQEQEQEQPAEEKEGHESPPVKLVEDLAGEDLNPEPEDEEEQQQQKAEEADVGPEPEPEIEPQPQAEDQDENEEAESEQPKEGEAEQKGEEEPEPQEEGEPGEEKVQEGEEPSQQEEITEDQMIEIAQRCFSSIAEKMKKKNVTIAGLFKDAIYKKTVDGEEVDLIAPNDFLSGLKNLGIADLQGRDYQCLVKMLAANDADQGFRVKDLMQILEDYGIHEEGTDDDLAKDMQFDDLDKVSMVLLLALTEYLINAKVPLYDLFGEAIYKQPVQVDDNELEVDIINSEEFFKVLNKIGINTEEKEHDNLKSFLCIDPSYLDKFSVDKLKAAIEEFAMNEDLRKRAQDCYQELVDEEQLQEEPAEGQDPDQEEKHGDSPGQRREEMRKAEREGAVPDDLGAEDVGDAEGEDVGHTTL